jgi:ketosteroid isomerase-like protein
MRYAFILLALLLFGSANPGWANDAESLRAIDASWNDLRLKADVVGLDRLLADDWLLTHSDGRVQDKKDYLQELSSRSRSNQAIENEDVNIRHYGGTAVVTGTSVQAGTSNGLPWSGRFRYTRVWILREGRWQMVASHSSRIAVENSLNR